jgi:hypothetical protein
MRCKSFRNFSKIFYNIKIHISRRKYEYLIFLEINVTTITALTLAMVVIHPLVLGFLCMVPIVITKALLRLWSPQMLP